jgi:NTP pyrophosphatase (non-canonical NTP hydrolase)
MMSKFTNVELNLEILVEECAEGIQMKSKIIRFGLWENKDKFTQEIGDVLAMVDILKDNGIFTDEELEDAKARKIDKLGNFYTE